MADKVKSVVEELRNPPDPFDIFQNLHGYPYPFFLDSACGPEKLGRFSFVGCEPFLVFRSKGRDIALEWSDGRKDRFTADPFEAISDILSRYRSSPSAETPFPSGAVGYFSYDMKNFLEKLPERSDDDIGIPDCALGFYDSAVTYDNMSGRCYLSAAGVRSGGAPDPRGRIGELRKRLASPPPARFAPRGERPEKLESNFSKAAYIKAVRRAKDYIRKGDIYQVNLSQRFETAMRMSPVDLYRRLRESSPAPFAAYLDFKDFAILSSSPERFLMTDGSYIETRPIKGTRPRGATKRSDALLEKELAHSAKDMAEHIMIVDLERNDLGRICRYGSVKPTESAVIEKYANVFHMVSTVSGRLKRGVDPIGCLRAAFPGGSITGAPKIRSMEIIDELEPVSRSAYTGAVGYISFDGKMDTSIVIRTFLVKDGKVYFQVGGGIVADSDPEEEYEETLHKARGLMEALGIRSGSLKSQRPAHKTYG